MPSLYALSQATVSSVSEGAQHLTASLLAGPACLWVLQDAISDDAATAAAAGPDEARSTPPAQPAPASQQASHLAQRLAVPMQPLGSGIHSPNKQLHSPGRFASPRPKQPNGALSLLGGNNNAGTTSQATSGQDTGADEGADSEDEGEGEQDEEDGDEEGEGDEETDTSQQGKGSKGGRRRNGANAGSSTPNRPQRIRKPKQYLGEDTQTTPTRNRRGSLPTTPASAGRRPVSQGGLHLRSLGATTPEGRGISLALHCVLSTACWAVAAAVAMQLASRPCGSC